MDDKRDAFWNAFADFTLEHPHPALAGQRVVHGNPAYREFDMRLPMAFRPRGVALMESDEIRAELFSSSRHAPDLFARWKKTGGIPLTQGGSRPNLHATARGSGARIDFTLRGGLLANQNMWPGLVRWLAAAIIDLADSYASELQRETTS